MTQRVVIVGGGFGGLYAARRLARGPVQVTLVDRQNYHLFQPLLYQVATAGLSPGDIATPIRSLLATQSNVEVRMSEVVGIDLAGKQVQLVDGVLDYDFLVLATGVSHAYFGHDEWERFAPGLKTLDDALEMRRRVLTAFEEAEKENDERRRETFLTFVVVGGGPTGVELAGAIAELARFTVARDYRRFDPKKSRVILVEAGARVLTAFDESLSARALSSLQKLGVEVRLSTRVTGIDADGVLLEAERLSARHGVVGRRRSRLAALDVAGGRAGSLGPGEGAARSLHSRSPLGLRGGRPRVLHPARWLDGARASPRRRSSRVNTPRTTSSPRPWVTPPSRSSTATRASWPRWAGRRASPRPARSSCPASSGWCAWLFIHILYLIGFRNRLLVMIQWAWAWFTFGRSARLITGTGSGRAKSVAECPEAVRR